MIIQNFDLNLIPDSAPVVVHCDQYDRGTGRLVVSLYIDAISYSPSGTAIIQGVKPDGRGFMYNATMSGNVVTADLTEQMTAVAGRVRCQIVVTEASGRTGTFVFELDVQKSALPADTDMSESDYQLIEQAIEDAQQAVTDAQNSAEDAEAWAVGERGGVPVPTSDDTYHNNAKYWAEQAAQYAQGGIIFKGSVAFASIPTTGMADGDMYNITNDFTTDSRFIEGAGKECAAGTNIVWIEDVEKWDIFAMSKIGSLDDLNDVEITSPSSGEVLKYDGSKWVNGAGGSASGDYVGLYGDTLVGSDLNNITSVGNYYNDGTVTVSHYPSNAIITATSSFRLTVEKMGDSASTNLRQTYVLDNSVDFVYERHRTNENWSSWQKVLTSYSNIGELDNVSISSPTNNQVLTYNSTTQKWENANAQGGSGDYVGLYGMTEIQSSDGQGTTEIDLDTYTSVGNYYCNGKGKISPRYYYYDNEQTVINARGFSDAVFILVVKKLPNNNLTQELTICTDTNQTSGYFRLIRYKGISGWTYWSRQGSHTGYAIYLTVNQIYDTSLSSLATGDVLVYNNTNLKWQNKPLSGYISNPNLIDNPWFTINQRGQSTYTGIKYTVDRWKLLTNTGTLTVNSDGSITVTTTGECWLVQYLPLDVLERLKGRTITLSIDAEKSGGISNLYSGYNTESSGWQRISDDLALPTTRGIVSRTVTIPTSFVGTPTNYEAFGIYIGANISVTIYSTKVELGSISTLALDTAPNYATELLKCQRYFQRLGSKELKFVSVGIGNAFSSTSIRVNASISPMRTQPAITKSGNAYLNNGSTGLTVAGISCAYAKDNNSIWILCEVTSATVGSFYELVIANTASDYIDLTADL